MDRNRITSTHQPNGKRQPHQRVISKLMQSNRNDIELRRPTLGKGQLMDACIIDAGLN